MAPGAPRSGLEGFETGHDLGAPHEALMNRVVDLVDLDAHVVESGGVGRHRSQWVRGKSNLPLVVPVWQKIKENVDN